MRSQRLQDLLATGNFPLLVASLLASLYWLTGLSPEAGAGPSGLWDNLVPLIPDPRIHNLAGFGVCLVSVLLLWGLVVRFSLIRVHSTLYLTLYVVLTAGSLPHLLQPGLVVACCWIVALYSFFQGYQQSHPVVSTFQGCLFIGISSLFLPPVWMLFPLLFLLQMSLHMPSLRSFCAALLGLVLPYWFLLGYAAWCGGYALPERILREAFTLSPIDYAAVKPDQWAILALMAVLSLWSGAQYFARSFQDKIRTRTYLYYIMQLEALLFVFALLQPRHLPVLLPLLITGCSIPAGHYFAVTRSRTSLIALIVTLTALLALLAFDLWTQSPLTC